MQRLQDEPVDYIALNGTGDLMLHSTYRCRQHKEDLVTTPCVSLIQSSAFVDSPNNDVYI